MKTSSTRSILDKSGASETRRESISIVIIITVILMMTLACSVVGETPTPYPTYTPYPTFTPVSQPLEAFPFALTTDQFQEIDNIEFACGMEFGSAWQLADWNDILAYTQAGKSIENFVSTLALSEDTKYLVTNNSERWYAEERHYFVEFHNHILSEGWLSHADIDDHYIDLGSWSGINAKVICYDGSTSSVAEAEATPEKLETPDTPPEITVSYVGTQKCANWPHYAVFQVTNDTIWILQSANFKIQDTTNDMVVYGGSNNRPFVKEGKCPPGDTLLAPYNTRYVAVNIKEPAPGTNFKATIKLCTEEDLEGECATQVLSFIFEGGEAEQPETGNSEVPFIGTWKNAPVGMSLEFTERSLLKKFSFEGGLREIHYEITDFDANEGHIDLLTKQVLQDGEDVDYDWNTNQYLSYIINDGVMKVFIGPNPYPIAESGVSYTKE